MNAAKALLSSKGINFSPYHGVAHHKMRGPNSKVVLSNEGIAIRANGIVPALANYFGEAEPSNTHSLEAVLYNLVFVHRTYCLSYANKRERFLPLRDVAFVRDNATQEVWLSAKPAGNADWKYFRRNLPPEFVESTHGEPGIVSVAKCVWASPNRPSDLEINDLQSLNRKLRRVVHYINGSHTLWYLKSDGKDQIDRQSMTLTLAVMHRLSEICRYKPAELQSFLNGQKNWLLSEFVAMSPAQFLDEVACEMTGHQIMMPNVRSPN